MVGTDTTLLNGSGPGWLQTFTQADSKTFGLPLPPIVAFWIVLWLVPPTLGAQALAFVLFRIFDTVKPPPIRYFDARFKGGFGVMWDDILAAAYTLLIMALAVRFGVIA